MPRGFQRGGQPRHTESVAAREFCTRRSLVKPGSNPGTSTNLTRMIVLDTRQMLMTRAAEEYEALLSRMGVCSLHEFEHHMRVIHMLNARIISYERL